MIVLDEQLMGRDIDIAIRKWYRGSVRFVSDIKLGDVIKDETIPRILSELPQPTFVTINERDFWRKIDLRRTFCIVCFALSDAKVPRISELLRALLRKPEFHTKAARMGLAIRVTSTEVSYYSLKDPIIRTLGIVELRRFDG